jgi:hypothetical protein
MKHIPAALVLTLLWFVNVGHGQVLEIGADGKARAPQATSEYCAQVEPIRANLKLTGDTRVRGRVIDETTAPFQNSPIELRRFISAVKQVTVKKSSTDDDGKFDLGTVKRGEYRLLLSPDRGFKQPEKLACESKDCTLDTVLIANPTDQFATNCPIR